MTGSQTTPPAPKPRAGTWKRLGVIAALACLAFGAVLAALPWCAETVVVPALSAAAGAPGLQADVRRIGLSGLDLGRITLGPDAGITTGAVMVDWSIPGLLRGRLDSVRVLGLRVRVRKTDDGWTVPGLPNRTGGGGNDGFFLPRIGDFRVEGAMVVETGEGTHPVPFDIDGSISESGMLKADIESSPAGQKLALSISADLRNASIHLNCMLPSASLGALASLFPGVRNMPVAGNVSAQAEATLVPGQTPQARTSLKLDSAQALLGSTHLRQAGSASLDAEWSDGLRAAFSGMRLDAPRPLVLTVADIHADLREGTFGCSWNVELPAPVADAPALHMRGRTEALRTQQGWKANTRAELAAIETLLPSSPTLKISLAPSTLVLDVAHDGQSARMDAGLDPGVLRLDAHERSATLSGLSLTCNATAGHDGMHGALTLAGGRLKADGPGFSLASTRLDGSFLFSQNGTFALEGSANAGIRARSGSGLATADLTLPLAWPAPPKSAGMLTAALKWGKNDLAKFSCSAAQTLHGLTLDGSVSVLPLNAKAVIRGSLDLRAPSNSRLEITSAQDLVLPGRLGAFAPALASLKGKARLEASARLDQSRGTPAIPTALKLSGLTVSGDKTKFSLEGGFAAITLPNLLDIRSEPDQRLTFERLRLGSVEFDKGDIRFQVEAPRSILVEGCSFRWAGGRVGTQAFRVNPEVEDYAVELYCDRVELAQALGQLGMKQARGGGTANGRIPVRWEKGKLTFDNGFLYSTPGEKGVLRIPGTEILTAGVPPGTPQYAQLDLASEALKDFSYEWAKVRMNTQEKELVVSLELDGKPAGPLPFTYDREIGGFARVSASSPGSVFQGIRLDVNFRLPLDQLLQYRQILELMNNGG